MGINGGLDTKCSPQNGNLSLKLATADQGFVNTVSQVRGESTRRVTMLNATKLSELLAKNVNARFYPSIL
jgi:hypothetical protein